MPKPVAASDLGHPLWRDVFGKLTALLDAFETLDQNCDRTVTPDDEIGYTIGRFMRTLIAKRDPARLTAVLEGFQRGLQETTENEGT